LKRYIIDRNGVWALGWWGVSGRADGYYPALYVIRCSSFRKGCLASHDRDWDQDNLTAVNNSPRPQNHMRAAAGLPRHKAALSHLGILTSVPLLRFLPHPPGCHPNSSPAAHLHESRGNARTVPGGRTKPPRSPGDAVRIHRLPACLGVDHCLGALKSTLGASRAPSEAAK
jgi:hypothetical protein